MRGAGEEPTLTGSEAAFRRNLEESIRAELNARYLRAGRLAYLRGFAIISLPLWLDAHWRALPDFLSFCAVAAGGALLTLAVAHGVLEGRWSRRAAEAERGPSVVHAIWTAWDDIRAGLWEGLAVTSLWPWIHAAAGATPDPALLTPMTAAAWAILVLLAGAETVARAQSRGRGQHAGAHRSAA